MAGRRVILSDAHLRVANPQEHGADAGWIIALTPMPQGGVEERPGRLEVAELGQDVGQLHLRLRGALSARLAQRLPQPQTLGRVALRGPEVALQIAERGGEVSRLRFGRRVPDAFHRDGRLEALPPLTEMPMNVPETSARRRETQAQIGHSGVRRGPVQRAPHVVMVGFEALQRLMRMMPNQVALVRLCPLDEMSQVAPTRFVDVRRRGQPRPYVCSNRLEHAVADLIVAFRHDHQRSIDQLCQRIEHILCPDPCVGTHAFCRIECPPTGERRTALQHPTFGLVEQVVAPVQRGLERLLARMRGAAAAGEQAEAIVEPVGDLAHAQRTDAGGGQLDGEGQSVEAATDLGDGWADLGGELKVGRHRRGAVDEKAPGFGVSQTVQGAQAVGRLTPGHGFGQGERGHRKELLAGQPQPFAAGRQDAQLGAGAEQGIRQTGCACRHVFAVVEDQQGAARPEMCGQGVRPILGARLR